MVKILDGVWTLDGGARCFILIERQVQHTELAWKKGTATTQRSGQPRKAGKTTAPPQPAPRGVGAGEGACLPGPRLDVPCLRPLSRSPRWGRRKLSTTSTTRRHRIWWNCRYRRTKSLWQTSKMSSRSQITNSSSNLWTMTSGNCFRVYFV